MKINGNLAFNTDASGEIQNVYVERLATAPAFTGLQKGRLYFNTTTSLYYYNDGSAWVPFATGGNAAALQAEVDALETSLGASVNADGTFNAAGFAGAANITSATSITNAILQLDTAVNANNELAELDDVTLGTMTNKDVLYYDAVSSTWKNAQPGATSGVQQYDAGLTSFAALTTPGFVSVVDGDTVVTTSLVAPAAGFTISNPAGGAGGNSVFALSDDLAALETLVSTGIAVRTAADTWATRTIVSGATGTIVVADGEGVAGNPTLNLETLTIPTDAGSLLKFSYDTFGRVTATQAVTTADLTTLLDATYVNATGDSMSGNLNMGGNTVTGLANPSVGSDAANKNYVDALSAGLSWKQAVRLASTGNIDLANGGVQSIDGINTQNGDRVLVKDQASSAENGIYIANSGTWTRALDADSTAEMTGLTVFVAEGTQWADTGWTMITDNITIGSSALTFAQFTGAGTYSAGVGLSLTGNTFAVNLGAGIAELPGDEVGLDLFTASAGALILTTNGTARSTDSAASLHLLLDGASLGQGVDGLKIADNGVTQSHINSSALAANGGLTGGSGTTLAVNVDDATIGITANVVAVKDSGITTVKIADGNVTNAKLANPYISIGDGTALPIQVMLGDSLSAIGSNGITTSFDGSTIGIALNAMIGQLNDVEITGVTAGQVLVANEASTFVNSKVYHLYSSTAPATTHTVTHDIGQQYCNVTVVDATDEVVIPQSITFSTANQLVVTFTSAIDCKIVVMGVNLNPMLF